MKQSETDTSKKRLSLRLSRTVSIGMSLSILLILGSLANWELPPAFGATITLLTLAPTSQFSRPRNVIGGYLLSTLVAFLVLMICGSTPDAEVIAVVGAVLLSLSLHVVHPPASAMALFVVQNHSSLRFLLVSVFVGVVILVAVCTTVNTFITPKELPQSASAQRGPGETPHRV